MALTLKEKRELYEEFKKEIIKELIMAKQVYVEVCRKGVELPQYANIGDAGMDVRSAEEVILLSGETKIIKTGLKMVIPEGYELQVRPRSGLSFKTPLRIGNSPGTIDSGFRDEIGIILSNDSFMCSNDIDYYKKFNESINNNFYSIDEKDNKHGAYIIKKGDRIAQIVLAKFEVIEFVPVDDVKKYGLNRGGGFGSTGTK